MNEVARATYEDAQAHYGFLQIPGKVVGGEAPADCLAGKDCIGDARMAALAAENGQLASDAAGVRSLLADDERARGKPYTAEERKTRVAALQATLASIGKSSDPLRQEARRLIGEGNVAGGEAKLDEALDADEKAAGRAGAAGAGAEQGRREKRPRSRRSGQREGRAEGARLLPPRHEAGPLGRRGLERLCASRARCGPHGRGEGGLRARRARSEREQQSARPLLGVARSWRRSPGPGGFALCPENIRSRHPGLPNPPPVPIPTMPAGSAIWASATNALATC